jgi:high affinity sulfate transporter 1
VFRSLRGYRRDFARGDLIAGLTVWAVLVPEALAYASIAGVSPVVGLYAAPGALLLYAAFGSSRHLIVGPMSATAALSAAAVADATVGRDDKFAAVTAALAITVGLIALLAGLLRLGFLANFISEPVLKGFIVGLALTIIIGQVPKLLGIEKAKGNFFEQLREVLRHLGDTQLRTLVVGLLSLAIVLVLREVAPAVPGSLVAVIFGIVAVQLLDLDQHGVAIVGHITSGLPSLGFPDVATKDYFKVAGDAVGIALVGFAEGLGAAKTYAAREHYEIDANRELIGLGAANAVAGLSSGMVVNGSLSKTAVNGSAGAKSQVSGLLVAVLTIVTLLFLTGLFEDLPEATLAAVVIAAVIELIDYRALIELFGLASKESRRAYGLAARPDFIAAIAALLGVLIFDTLPGLFIGIGASILLLVYQTSKPHVARLGKVPGTLRQFSDFERHPDNEAVPGIVIARPESGLLFVNAEAVRTTVRAMAAEPGTTAVILDAETVPLIDITAVRMLHELAESLEREGVRFVIARDVGMVRDLVERGDQSGVLTHVYPTVQAAVDALRRPSGGDQPG